MIDDDDDDDDDDERKKETKMKRTRTQNKSRSEFAHSSYLSSNNSHHPSFPLLLSTCTYDTRISLIN